MNFETRTPTGCEEVKKEKRKGNYRYTKNRETAIKMRENGMSFQQIADELGVTKQRVSQYCAGEMQNITVFAAKKRAFMSVCAIG